MLPSLTLLRQLERAGEDSGYHGESAEACPYKTPMLADPWLKGWKKGQEQRDRSQSKFTRKESR